LSLKGRDVAGQAQTGTGKTAAFLITVLDRLMRIEDRDPVLPSALIIAPTRELALQISHDAQVLGAHTGLRMTVAFGGVDYEKQARALKEGADIVIGTPGRLIDYMKQRLLQLRRVRVLVIDEADRMFDMGFIRDLRYMLRRLPPYDKRQSMLFSATLSYRVIELAYEHMNLPEEIYIEPQERTVDTVEQSVYHVGQAQKLSLLLGLLKREPWERVLIFSNTKSGVEFLATKLEGNGYPAEGITGDLPQKKRLRLMERFKSGELKIVVATDVASRGIHVEDISHVINYDLPQDREDYVHRIGRTARAGKTGKAISLADEKCVWFLEPIEAFLGKKIPVIWYEDEWLETDLVPRIRPRRFAEREGEGRQRSKERPRRGPVRRKGPGDESRPSRPPARPPREARPAGESGTEERAQRPRRRQRKPRERSSEQPPQSVPVSPSQEKP
jgi:ATP-dependent RNA helicase RhlB